MDKHNIDLAWYRLDKANECLKTSTWALENECYNDSANRSYYAIFHAARAVMALDGEDRKKHSGVISYFLEHYIKTKEFDTKFSKVIQNAFDVRQGSDYRDFFIISKQEVIDQLEDAREFFETVKNYIQFKI